MLMQQNYPPLNVKCIRLALDAYEKRQGARHEATLKRLRSLARLINL